MTRPHSHRFGRAEIAPGLLVVDKPFGLTSHGAVSRVRRLAGTRRVGHAGTLDPMATGLLVVGIGSATRLLGFVGKADKDYEATIRLGVSTVSDDADGEVTARRDASGVTMAAVEEAIEGLRGEIRQVPSSVSAVKVDGKRSYARVRDGDEVELDARLVTVSTFRVVSMERGEEWLDLEVAVSVSSGTYVRALARDLGAALGVGGHLTALRRTRVGRFRIAQAHTLDDLLSRVEAGEPLPLLGLAEAAQAAFPFREVTAEEAEDLAHGRRVARIASDGTPGEANPIALIGPGIVALAVDDGDSLRPTAVLTDPTAR